MLIIAALSAILLPLLFLYIIYALDLYASGRFRTVALCFVWGLTAFALALGVNTAIKNGVLEGLFHMDTSRSFTLTVILVAPIVEEILKSLILVYLARRPDFAYFVDGAIYGFAAGIGFSVLENLWYMAQPQAAGQGIMLVVSRSFSTCLMHGSASALVGVSIGRFRYGHGGARLLSTILGWAAAMVLHSIFNRVVQFWEGPALLLGVVGLGVGGMVLIALFIRWGLAEEKKWIEETLGAELGVTGGEKALVMELHDLEALLRPVKRSFGKEKATLVEQFLLKQAQLGIKQKSLEMTTSPQLRGQVQSQIDDLQTEIDQIRRQVGVYCMTYVRSIIPLEQVVEWAGPLAERVAQAQRRPARSNLWGDLQSRAAARAQDRPDAGG